MGVAGGAGLEFKIGTGVVGDRAPKTGAGVMGAAGVGDLGGGVGLGVLKGAKVGDLSLGGGVGLGVLKGEKVGEGKSGTAGVGGGKVGIGGNLGSGLGVLVGNEENELKRPLCAFLDFFTVFILSSPVC